MDLPERLMMMVSSSAVLVNRLQESRSAAAGGRSALEIGFLHRNGKATAYKAPGAAIEGVRATSVAPEIDVLKRFAVIAAYAAASVEGARASKYTSSGVRYSRA